jgi:NAD(P)-dependent dehydrogenase (short-subunit alcohol dehydrogenase family)
MCRTKPRRIVHHSGQEASMGVYLVTGGANGIGAEIAMHLHGAGNSILFADIDRVDLPGVRSVICDLSDEGQIASLMFGLEAVEGRLDGLVCHPTAHAHEDDFASTGLLINAAAGLLRQPRGAAVAVHHEGPAALPELTRILARDLGPDIRVDCIAPCGAEHIDNLAAYLLAE